MLRTDVKAVLAEVLRDRRLLDHPFYRRWEAGTLAPGELAAYAGQYRHFEALLPTVLETVVGRLADSEACALVQANLDDERGVPAPHLELFDAFAESVGAPSFAAPTAATERLTTLYAAMAELAPVAALGAVAAYEVQAPEIATSKAQGLRARYGIDATGTAFWDVHGGIDDMHAEWIVDAIAMLGDTPEELIEPARAAAQAWWAWLDEREALAPALAPC